MLFKQAMSCEIIWFVGSDDGHRDDNPDEVLIRRLWWHVGEVGEVERVAGSVGIDEEHIGCRLLSIIVHEHHLSASLFQLLLFVH